jgi:hypothetical protein
MSAASLQAGGGGNSGESAQQVWAPTAEEIEEEEEAARVYQIRREEARRKNEIHQAKEMKRILEEKRNMEEELEELRESTTRAGSSAAGTPAQGLHGTSPSTGNSMNNMAGAQAAEVQAMMNKKLSRMKKRYEKKLSAAKEALEDLQEDFSYQRKQFLEAATEQEKDVRLYELICQSVLSEKDLKRVGPNRHILFCISLLLYLTLLTLFITVIICLSLDN